MSSGRYGDVVKDPWFDGVHLRVRRYWEDIKGRVNPLWISHLVRSSRPKRAFLINSYFLQSFSKNQRDLNQIKTDLKTLFFAQLPASVQENYLTEICKTLSQYALKKIQFGKCSPNPNADVNSPEGWVDCCLHDQTIQGLIMGENTRSAVVTTKDGTVRYSWVGEQ